MLDWWGYLIGMYEMDMIFLIGIDSAFVSGNKDFAEVKQLPAPDVVKCMAWVGDSLCLGIKREYVIINISTGASFDVFPCGRHSNPLAVTLPNGELLLGKVTDSLVKCLQIILGLSCSVYLAV